MCGGINNPWDRWQVAEVGQGVSRQELALFAMDRINAPYARLESMRKTDDLGICTKKKSSSPESGRVKKGAVNVAKMGLAACKSRAALTVRKERKLRGELPKMPW